MSEQERLNDHTERAINELDDIVAIWVSNGIDWRAIFVALATYHSYYGRQIGEKVGGVYLMKLQDAADRMANDMLKKQALPK